MSRICQLASHSNLGRGYKKLDLDCDFEGGTAIFERVFLVCRRGGYFQKMICSFFVHSANLSITTNPKTHSNSMAKRRSIHLLMISSSCNLLCNTLVGSSSTRCFVQAFQPTLARRISSSRRLFATSNVSSKGYGPVPLRTDAPTH